MVEESKRYVMKYRSILENHRTKTYNDAMYMGIDRKISFDMKEETYSSIDHFASSILSELLLALDEEAGRRKEALMDVEGTIQLEISNPLVLLHVHGCGGVSKITSARIRIYLFTFLEEGEREELVEAALASCVLYGTLKDALNLELSVEYAL